MVQVSAALAAVGPRHSPPPFATRLRHPHAIPQTRTDREKQDAAESRGRPGRTPLPPGSAARASAGSAGGRGDHVGGRSREEEGRSYQGRSVDQSRMLLSRAGCPGPAGRGRALAAGALLVVPRAQRSKIIVVISISGVIHIGRVCGAALPGVGRDVPAAVPVRLELALAEAVPVRWEWDRAPAAAFPRHQPGPFGLSPP